MAMTTKRNNSRRRVNPPVGKALTCDLFQDDVGALVVAVSKRGAVVVADRWRAKLQIALS